MDKHQLHGRDHMTARKTALSAQSETAFFLQMLIPRAAPCFGLENFGAWNSLEAFQRGYIDLTFSSLKPENIIEQWLENNRERVNHRQRIARQHCEVGPQEYSEDTLNKARRFWRGLDKTATLAKKSNKCRKNQVLFKPLLCQGVALGITKEQTLGFSAPEITIKRPQQETTRIGPSIEIDLNGKLPEASVWSQLIQHHPSIGLFTDGSELILKQLKAITRSIEKLEGTEEARQRVNRQFVWTSGRLPSENLVRDSTFILQSTFPSEPHMEVFLSSLRQHE